MFIEIRNFMRGCSQPKTLALPIAVAALCAGPSEVNASTLGNTFDDLMSGSKVTAVVLSHGKTTRKYFKDKDKNIEGMDRQYELGQSVGLFYRTGKTRIGTTPVKVSYNLGYSYMFNLDDSYPGDRHNWNGGEKIFISEKCYWSGVAYDSQYKCEESGDYGKIAINNLRFNWGKKTNSGQLIIGDGFFNAGMITAATDDDALLSSYRGLMFKQKYGEYTFDGAYVIGFMSGNEDEMQDLRGNANYYDPTPINYDYLYTARVKRVFGKTSGYTLAYGEAKDYLRRSMASAYYNLKLNSRTNLFMQSQYYYNKSAGNLWEQDVEKGQANFDDYASAISYEFRLQRSAVELLYGFTKINAPKEDGNGSFSYGFGKSKGYLKLPTSGNLHGFRRDGEESMVLQTKYDFRYFGLPDFSISYGYHWGRSPIESKTTGATEYGNEHEHAVTVNFEPKAGSMKGFVFNLKQAFYRPDATIGQLTDEDMRSRADKNTVKFTMSYMFNL